MIKHSYFKTSLISVGSKCPVDWFRKSDKIQGKCAVDISSNSNQWFYKVPLQGYKKNP